jgi:hypothetical protein
VYACCNCINMNTIKKNLIQDGYYSCKADISA